MYCATPVEFLKPCTECAQSDVGGLKRHGTDRADVVFPRSPKPPPADFLAVCCPLPASNLTAISGTIAIWDILLGSSQPTSALIASS